MVAVLSYLACILLWIGGTLLMIINKNPVVVLVLVLLHLHETLNIGLKVGREFGKKDSVSIASCLCFGFL
ncbi:MAG: hypothetical protein IJG86_05610, partial [Clostridia bacterium]|nr:hypothetical protein [Clostridia bacterium]